MSSSDRQRIERVPGSRRAKLTPAPGTRAEPVPGDGEAEDDAADAASTPPAGGPNDERLRRDVPPHY
ncbi:hypothetical protein [Microbacterium sp. BK668]|uniref:hypothetical protein n=1 Tax=Microbacterium sp. BK668 TaxID=2512118 RepID=UPI001060B8DD|nr:hypothetical protein [Microbacterium sp. BK668]